MAKKKIEIESKIEEEIKPTKPIPPPKKIPISEFKSPVVLPPKPSLKKLSPKKQKKFILEDDDDFSIADLDEENFEIEPQKKKIDELFFEQSEELEEEKQEMNSSDNSMEENDEIFTPIEDEQEIQFKTPSLLKKPSLIPVRSSIIPVNKTPPKRKLIKGDDEEDDFFSKFDSKPDESPPDCIKRQNTFKSPIPIPYEKKITKTIIDDDDEEEVLFIPKKKGKIIDDDDNDDEIPKKRVLNRNFKAPSNIMQKFSNQIPSVLEIVKIATS